MTTKNREAPAMEIEVDDRQRVSLGKFIGKDVTRFRVTSFGDDGEILLTPVVSLSKRELSVLANPERVASIKAGIVEAKEGKVRRYEPGHWTKAAEEMEVAEA
jgi:hypothetical protein